jgi:ABC-2 type transport system ATP-binding protein
MEMNAIQIKNVTKRYKNVTALDNVSLSFEFGKIYGLLGRNGAGKSTLINIMANRIFADHGEICINGAPAKENMHIHEKIFCMSETDLYDKDLKVIEHLKWTGRFYDNFDTDKALKFAKKFNLDINKRFGALSKGYQSIFKLVIALSLNIPYVIFDEPVLGLDANHRELFYSLLLAEYENNERTFIIATHLIEEVAGIMEEVVLIDNGKILLQESVENLLKTGYSVSGPAKEVDHYCRGKKVIGCDNLGALKISYVLDKKSSPLPEGSLQISAINLQKLFVKLTEKGGNQNE